MTERRQKYGNTKVEVDGVVFQSKKEAARYAELKLLVAGGAISGLQLQPVFELQAKFTDAKGVKHRAINYTADFCYMSNGTLTVEEVKGFETREWLLKRKLFLFKFRSILLEVIR